MAISPQKTIIILKHDAVARGLMGEILKRFERAGLKMVAFKFIQAPADLAVQHYPSDDAWYRTAGERTLTEYKEKGIDPVKELGTADAIKIGKLIKKWNVDYLTEGPILATVWEGYDAIKVVRKLVGSTKPAEAAPGTIRGDFSIDNVELANALKRPFRNLIHASGNEAEAENELDLWFDASELCNDYFRADQEMMFKAGV
jgi:nucleoside-diphosphate kinase